MKIYLNDGTLIVADRVAFHIRMTGSTMSWQNWTEQTAGEVRVRDIDYIIDAQTEDNLRQQG